MYTREQWEDRLIEAAYMYYTADKRDDLDKILDDIELLESVADGEITSQIANEQQTQIQKG